MAGSVYQVGEQKIRPGVYVRVTNIANRRRPLFPGVVAVF